MIAGIIPARYASTRFPGKPLAEIHGKTMIRRVYEQVLKAKKVSTVAVATDDDRIAGEVRRFGGNVVMTSQNHRSGTERCAEALTKLSGEGQDFEVVINIQGDEPFIDPEQIDLLAQMFRQKNLQIGTLIKPVKNAEELASPNVVKVVISKSSKALYFSRSVIPYVRSSNPENLLKNQAYYAHVGMYGYRAGILREIVRLSPGVLEQAESLEQLRWLEHGYDIHTQLTHAESLAVDTPEDLSKIINI